MTTQPKDLTDSMFEALIQLGSPDYDGRANAHFSYGSNWKTLRDVRENTMEGLQKRGYVTINGRKGIRRYDKFYHDAYTMTAKGWHVYAAWVSEPRPYSAFYASIQRFIKRAWALELFMDMTEQGLEYRPEYLFAQRYGIEVGGRDLFKLEWYGYFNTFRVTIQRNNLFLEYTSSGYEVMLKHKFGIPNWLEAGRAQPIQVQKLIDALIHFQGVAHALNADMQADPEHRLDPFTIQANDALIVTFDQYGVEAPPDDIVTFEPVHRDPVDDFRTEEMNRARQTWRTESGEHPTDAE